MGRGEFKHAEFLKAYNKKFKVDHETMIHEDHTLGAVSSLVNIIN